jgi:outer membrane protein assembly factor BamB
VFVDSPRIRIEQPRVPAAHGRFWRKSVPYRTTVPDGNRPAPVAAIAFRAGRFLALALLLLAIELGASADNWPQAAGPNLDWRYDRGSAPTTWSVSLNRNIAWRSTMPNGGQGGIIAWGNRLFLTTFEEYKEGDPKFSATILGHCLDARTGKILWSVKLTGENPSPLMYAYSDSTSWTPVTDGRHVWFFNSSGEMGCWDFAGKEIWRRKFRAPGEPFNKQLEPILFGSQIISVEPLAPGERGYRADRDRWHYLRGIDKRSGKTLWTAEDGITYYCTPVFGRLPDGTPAILGGRGGPHDVPERPIGLSLTSLKPGSEGKTIWTWTPEDLPGGPVDGTTFQALYTMTWDSRYAYAFRHAPEESHLVLDAQTGKLLRTQSLIRNVDFRQWDPSARKYVLHKNVNIRDMKDFSPRVPLKPGEVLHVFPNWHSNIAAYGYHYFLTSTGHRRNGHAPPGLSGPSHCVGRVNIETGKVEYLEVPVTVIRKPGVPDQFVYNVAVATKTEDYRGRDVGAEDRSRTDGWQVPAFFGSPVAIDGKIYLSTMLGITYVIDGRAPVLNEKALLSVSDLGPSGETWSLNSLSYQNGRLYDRSLCIGAPFFAGK